MSKDYLEDFIINNSIGDTRRNIIENKLKQLIYYQRSEKFLHDISLEYKIREELKEIMTLKINEIIKRMKEEDYKINTLNLVALLLIKTIKNYERLKFISLFNIYLKFMLDNFTNYFENATDQDIEFINYFIYENIKKDITIQLNERPYANTILNKLDINSQRYILSDVYEELGTITKNSIKIVSDCIITKQD